MSLDALGNQYADVVIDALPRLEPSHAFVKQCLRRSIMVTANKALVVDVGGWSA